MSYWRSNITCRAIEIVSGFVQDALQPSELIVTGPKTRSITCYSRIIFFYKTGGGGGPSLSDYICKFNKLNFSGRRPPPSCRTVSPRHIRVDRPWSCRSINIKKKTVYVLRTKVARGFGLIYLIMEYILVRKLLDCRTKVHVVRVVDHLETCYIKFPIY